MADQQVPVRDDNDDEANTNKILAHVEHRCVNPGNTQNCIAEVCRCPYGELGQSVPEIGKLATVTEYLNGDSDED